MSCVRSRSGGSTSGNTARRYQRSARNSPRCTMPGRSALVAATTRTSTVTVSSPPTRVMRPSCNTRSRRTCAAFGRSATSSSSSVPRSERSNQPRLRAAAPVKLPFSWPNSSESTSSAGMAPQLTRVKGPSARRERTCTARAMTSLPEPVSPRMSTGRSEPATISTRSITGARPPSPPTTASTNWLRPRRVSSDERSASAARRRAVSSRRRRSFSRAVAKGSRNSAHWRQTAASAGTPARRVTTRAPRAPGSPGRGTATRAVAWSASTRGATAAGAGAPGCPVATCPASSQAANAAASAGDKVRRPSPAAPLPTATAVTPSRRSRQTSSPARGSRPPSHAEAWPVNASRSRCRLASRHSACRSDKRPLPKGEPANTTGE